MNTIFERQREHAPAMARTSAPERRQRLRGLRNAVDARRGEIVAAINADLGRPPFESELAEIGHVVREIDYAIRKLPRWMRGRRGGTPLELIGSKSRLVVEPRGMVLIVAPWNYPFALVINPLVAAIAAGNCAMLKPSEKAPATSHVLHSIVEETFDEREVAVVEGGPDVATALLELPFDHFFFTGGSEIGKLVMAAAARHLASVTLELGGKTPAVIDASADVAAAARSVAWSKFFNAGQTCLAPDYVMVHESVEAQFIGGVLEAVAAFYGRKERDRQASPDFGRIVDEAHFDRLVELIQTSVAHGARLEVGGEWDAESRYVAPTVLSGVAPDMPLMQEEIFGPVLPVLTYRGMDDLLAVTRRNGKPLGSYIFSRHRRMTDELLRAIPAGGSTVNDALLHYISPDLPFGGVGSSGFGTYHGYFGFLAMSHVRAVLWKRRWPFGRLFHPPFRGRMHELTKRVLRWLE
jgi:aldehyde dehydrogenase (NAD+)